MYMVMMGLLSSLTTHCIPIPLPKIIGKREKEADEGEVTHVSSNNNRNYPLRSMIAFIYDTAGIQKNLDGNDGDLLDYFEFASNTFEGERQRGADFYPRGENVTFWTERVVSKLLVEGAKAVGVEVLGNGGESKVVRRGRGAGLCGG